MEIETQNSNGIIIVAPIMDIKRLDARSAGRFKEAMSAIITEGQHRTMVLDLTGVEFIDSSGLGAIISCLKMMGPKGRLGLCGLGSQVDSVLKLTHMDRVFTICTTAEQAVQALCGEH